MVEMGRTSAEGAGELNVKKWGIVIATLLISSGATFAYAQSLGNDSLRDEVVGMSHYGGEYDWEKDEWYVDNKHQCDLIKSGAIPAGSLGAEPTDTCDDDIGIGNADNPLHNTVSYAELSNDWRAGDFSALGKLPNGTKLQIENLENPGQCVVAEKLDVGLGGNDVDGYPRAVDLWWQTSRTLGFDGLGLGKVTSVKPGTPLTAPGQTTECVGAWSQAGAAEVAAYTSGTAFAIGALGTVGYVIYSNRRKPHQAV